MLSWGLGIGDRASVHCPPLNVWVRGLYIANARLIWKSNSLGVYIMLVVYDVGFLDVV